jgi:hypothetical protein
VGLRFVYIQSGKLGNLELQICTLSADLRDNFVYWRGGHPPLIFQPLKGRPLIVSGKALTMFGVDSPRSPSLARIRCPPVQLRGRKTPFGPAIVDILTPTATGRLSQHSQPTYFLGSSHSLFFAVFLSFFPIPLHPSRIHSTASNPSYVLIHTTQTFTLFR